MRVGHGKLALYHVLEVYDHTTTSMTVTTAPIRPATTHSADTSIGRTSLIHGSRFLNR